MDGYGRSTYGDGFADVYDDWYADVTDPAATAAFVAGRVGGLVVELGSGTGRLAAPLRAAGVPVVGLDASDAMLRHSRRRDPGVPVVLADMAEPPIRPRSVAGVLVAFNTLFNLPTPAGQRAALRQVADALVDDGLAIVEAFVPGDPDPSTRDRVDIARLDADSVVLRVSRTDHASGTVAGHHVELRDGAPVRLRPWHLCFTDPAGLDRLAESAGLELVERFGDWASTPFDDGCATHVSVYRPGGRRR